MYIAKEAGYYEKYGLHVNLVVANHPAGVAMLVSGQAQVNANTLQQGMQLTAKDPSIAMLGSPLRKWLLALIANKQTRTIRDLKGKRIGITQIGGSTYDYASRLLAVFGMSAKDVDWIALGDSSRGAALTAGIIDATVLSAPAYFLLEDAGYNSVANLNDYDDIFSPNVLLLKKSTIASDPGLAESLIKAHAEAVRRLYTDKQFAIQVYLAYDKQDVTGLNRAYETYVQSNAFDRVPYISASAVQYLRNNTPDQQLRAQMVGFDYHSVIDNSTVDRLVQDGFFEQTFGPEVISEQQWNIKQAFR
jgi:ABC-type nitrate/sulfonate/bicarbonate transport system substrate-binding protein